MKIKQRIFEIIQVAKPNDKLSRIFDISLMSLIMLNVCLVIADTFTLRENLLKIFSHIETVSVIIFTIEYILRVWTADLLYPEKNTALTAAKDWINKQQKLRVPAFPNLLLKTYSSSCFTVTANRLLHQLCLIFKKL